MLNSLSVMWMVLKAKLAGERGQDLLEYAMLGGLIVIAILAIVGAFTGALQSMVTGISNCIDFDAGTSCAGPF